LQQQDLQKAQTFRTEGNSYSLKKGSVKTSTSSFCFETKTKKTHQTKLLTSTKYLTTFLH